MMQEAKRGHDYCKVVNSKEFKEMCRIGQINAKDLEEYGYMVGESVNEERLDESLIPGYWHVGLKLLNGDWSFYWGSHSETSAMRWLAIRQENGSIHPKAEIFKVMASDKRTSLPFPLQVTELGNHNLGGRSADIYNGEVNFCYDMRGMYFMNYATEEEATSAANEWINSGTIVTSDGKVISHKEQSSGMNEERLDEYSNSPDEEMYDANYQLNSLAGGLNRPKRQYKKEYPGDNPLASELREKLTKKLEEFLKEE